jgi:hypothetical protein
LVLVEQRKPEEFQLQIKGRYDYQEIEIFLKDRGFSIEENMDYLIIS